METAVVWLLVLGPLLISIGAAIYWGSGSRAVGLWAGFVPGAVLFVIAAGIQWQINLGKAETPETPIKQPDSPDRPWVSIEIEIAGPLAHDAVGWDAGVRWHVPFRFKLTNTGNSPAIGVDFYGEIRPFMVSHWPADRVKDGVPQGEPIPGTNPVEVLKTICESQASMRTHFGSFMGQTIFKGRTYESILHTNANPALFDEAAKSPAYSGNILLSVCATYKSSTDDRIHQTGETFALYITNTNIDLNGGGVHQDKLRLTSQPMGGSFAN